MSSREESASCAEEGGAPAAAAPPPPPPVVPRHDPAVVPGREAVLDVRLVSEAGEGGSGPRCVATRAKASFPLKLIVPRHNASFALPALPASSPPLGPAAWCFVVGYGGGLVAGDVAALSASVRAGATAVLTTQSATKVFASRRAAGAPPPPPHPQPHPLPPPLLPLAPPPCCVYSLVAAVEPGGLLALLPDFVVPFSNSRLRSRVAVSLSPGASLVSLEWLSSGRAAHAAAGATCGAGEAWAFDVYDASTRVTDASTGAPLLTDALRLCGGGGGPSSTLSSRMGDAHVVATLVLIGPRVAAHAARLVHDLQPLTARCFERGRAAAAAAAAAAAGAAGEAGAAGGARDAPHGPAASLPPPAHPFLFAAGSALPPAGGGGCVVRLAAARADDAYAWARAALAGLHGELGGAPFASHC